MRSETSVAPPAGHCLWRRLLPAGAIVLVALAAYANSFGGALVYDDVLTIVENPSIRQWWPLTAALTPPPDSGLPVAGRPLVNLSLALNYAWGGTAPAGYHAVNLAIHALAALALFGCVRRSLLWPRWQGRFAGRTDALALAVALVWLAHPLQTGAVTYIVQRAESLMALFYLATLYACIRAAAAARPAGWIAAAIGACACGMATKEVMVSAPLVALLYDRAFVAGSLGAAWRRRWPLYTGLAATWIILIALVAATGSRGGTAGFATAIAPWDYALTQARAIPHYLRLAVWPAPLVFDYGVDVVHHMREVWPQLLLMLALVGGTLAALWRRPAAGFLPFWFFALLAPSSSLVPVATETMAEHRMYLPLAAAATLALLMMDRWLARRAIPVWGMAVLSLAAATARRNLDYRSELALWQDTVAKCPGNPRGHFNLGSVLSAVGRIDDAMRAYEAAIRLEPRFASAHGNLADVLFSRGRPVEARRHAEIALELNPALAEAHTTLGNVEFAAGRLEEALRRYAEAVRLRPDHAEMRNNLGTALAQQGRLAEAAAEYEAAIRLRPDFALAHFHLGNVLARSRRWTEAAARYEEALRLQPDYPAARDNLARVRAAAR